MKQTVEKLHFLIYDLLCRHTNSKEYTCLFYLQDEKFISTYNEKSEMSDKYFK